MQNDHQRTRAHLRQPVLAEMVADALRQDILDGRLADGSALAKQEDLLAEFGVSPPSLREALRILQAEGLITVRRGSVGGSVVHVPKPHNAAYTLGLVLQSKATMLEDVAQALLEIEPDCAAMCARRPDRHETVIPMLREINERMRQQIDDNDEYTRGGRAFHEQLVAGCANATMTLVAGSLEAIWSAHEQEWASAATAAGQFPEHDVRLTGVDTHDRLIDAIGQGDDQEAHRVARSHLSQTQRFALTLDDVAVQAALLQNPPSWR